MTYIERKPYSSENWNFGSKITKKDIIKEFGFNYEQVVTDNLKKGSMLPEGHMLNFFSIAKIHEGSSGLYLLEEIVGNNWIFVQAMLKRGVSTKHKHGENVAELYYPLAGESFLFIDKEEKRLEVGMPIEVFPGQVHQLTTRENPCLNLLIMKNSAKIPREKLHIPVT